MTVAELIEALQAMPGDAEALMYADSAYLPVDEVTHDLHGDGTVIVWPKD